MSFKNKPNCNPRAPAAPALLKTLAHTCTQLWVVYSITNTTCRLRWAILATTMINYGMWSVNVFFGLVSPQSSQKESTAGQDIYIADRYYTMHHLCPTHLIPSVPWIPSHFSSDLCKTPDGWDHAASHTYVFPLPRQWEVMNERYCHRISSFMQAGRCEQCGGM